MAPATDRIASFLTAQREATGTPPLSDAKFAAIDDPTRRAVVEEQDAVVAVAVVASHVQPNGNEHWSLETAVDASMRFVEFEFAVLSAGLALIPTNAASHSVWSDRVTLDDALGRLDYQVEKALHQLVVSLPLADTREPLGVRHFVGGDEAALIEVNRAAFSDHREASSLDREELADLMSTSWWDSDGVLFHEMDGQIAGFCWTKVHDDGRGEIFRIGVDPRYRGHGLGRRLVQAGYAYLGDERGCEEGFLWVDGSNAAAMALYASLGMVEDRTIREFGPT